MCGLAGDVPVVSKDVVVLPAADVPRVFATHADKADHAGAGGFIRHASPSASEVGAVDSAHVDDAAQGGIAGNFDCYCEEVQASEIVCV